MRLRGITLLELVIYIALVSTLMGSFIGVTMRLAKSQHTIGQHAHVTRAVDSVHWSFAQMFSEASDVDVTSSTLGTDPSSLIFHAEDGEQVTIDTQADTVTAGGASHTITRLRMTRASTGEEWMTGEQVSLNEFTVDVVRNSSGDLTGLRIQAEVTSLDDDLEEQDFDATYALFQHTSEL